MKDSEKRCSKCKIVKNRSEFTKNKLTKDGFHGVCKRCKKEYYKNNKERISEYYKNNKERISEYQKNNKERVSEYQKEYQKNNKEIINEAARIGIPIPMMREITEINNCGICAAIETNKNI